MRAVYYYRPQRNYEGYVFTGVCLSTSGGGCLPQCMLGCHTPGSRHTPTHPLSRIPPGQTPARSRHPPEHTPWSRHPPEQTCPPSRHPPGSRHPWEQTPLGADTLRSRHPQQTTPGAGIPPGKRTPRSRQPLLRTVRILLECILVKFFPFIEL